jgi:flagellar biosynthesis protein FlhG
MLVISGGRRGVGTTTLCVELAVALAEDARRIVLIDADLQHAGVAIKTQIAVASGIGEVLLGRKTVHEALQRGPAGMHLLAGLNPAEAQGNVTERNMDRLLRQFQTLGPHADWLVVDAGNSASELVSRLWGAADRLLLVTSPDAAAVMDTYALIKTLLSRQTVHCQLSLIVNQAQDESTAVDVHRRIDQSCRRFLGLSIAYAGAIPVLPLAGGLPNALLAAALAQLAKHLLQAPPAPRQAA